MMWKYSSLVYVIGGLMFMSGTFAIAISEHCAMWQYRCGNIMLGGGWIVAVVFWLVARDRRKAVDRLVYCIEYAGYHNDTTGLPTRHVSRQMIKTTIADAHDAPGRVIARSVERVTKE